MIFCQLTEEAFYFSALSNFTVKTKERLLPKKKQQQTLMW